ncbi:MAG TPA: phosphodiester glycosidase family protein [Verrucomicrobiae bacterium]|nr:phosphodiester glycosidase family protein [Verrucomicrobiae bacterium]
MNMKLRAEVLRSRVGWVCAALLAFTCLRTTASSTNEVGKQDRWFYYTNDVNDEVPLSIHVVRVELSHHDFEFCTSLGKGTTLGMAVVSDQVKALPAECGQPLAAINGDFYEKSEKYLGRPRDVEIHLGEVISTPAGHTSFWMDPDGVPHMTNVYSRFRVIWPDGKATPIGLNQQREDDMAVLYTAVTGSSTRTAGGTEYILEQSTNSPWLPLKIGQVYTAKVRDARASGDAPLSRDTMVLSIGPVLAGRVPALRPGATLQVATETVPDLSAARVAIGGGPALVQDGKPMQWPGFLHMRHPRTALGWNKDYFYMVEVDGRQSNLSVGMTFPELAAYLVKLGCTQAMNLDGGGSATLWALGAVRNSPSEGEERPSANALVLVRKKPAASAH